MEKILATILLRALEVANIMALAKAEGRKVSAEEIEKIRDGFLESDAELEAEIALRRAETG